jgi:hypothetical protein
MVAILEGGGASHGALRGAAEAARSTPLCRNEQRRRSEERYASSFVVRTSASRFTGSVRTERSVAVTSVAGVVLSQGLRPELISTPEWSRVCTRPHNAIFEGPEHVTETVLLTLAPYLRTPAIWTRAPTTLELPTDERGSLVLRNVSALDRHGQTALLRWLDADRQVISTTPRPLFPLIARGLFDEALYYRLNVMLLSIDATGAPL